MVKMEPIIKMWYDFLAEGKIMGKRCPECGAVMFPPVPVCGKCSCMDLEWTEMSSEGEIHSLTYSPMGVYPFNDEPCLSGWGKLKEGMPFNSVIVNPPAGGADELRERLRQGPVPAKLVITKLDDTISFPYFEIQEEKNESG